MRNRTNGSPEPAETDCLVCGHEWIPAPDGSPAAFVCDRCEAIGGECPEGGIPSPECKRCRGSGVVELVEITASEVAELRRDRRRFDWIARETIGRNVPSLATFRHGVDEMMAAGFRLGKLPAEAQKKGRHPPCKRMTAYTIAGQHARWETREARLL